MAMEQLKAEIVLANLLTHMPSHVYWKDIRGIYLGCNDQQARSLGLQRGDEVLHKTDFDLWDKTLARQLWENDCLVLKTGQSQMVEEQAKVNGKLATMLSLKAPIKGPQHQILGVMGISIDISAQKTATAKLVEAKEAAEAADKAKTEFIENICHDIRTPLSGILGAAGLIKKNLAESRDHAATQALADDLILSGQALSYLLNEVLEMVYVASGAIPLLKKKFNLKEKLQHIIDLNQCKARQKSLQLLLEYDDHIPLYLVGDAIRIQRMILELVTNALNYTQCGHVKVIATLSRKQGNTAILKIEVEDTGIGIASDKQELIFTRFKRLTPAHEGLYKGAGLGLAIVKQFIEELEGEIYVTSKPQIGSRLTCVLPLQVALLDEALGIDKSLIELPEAMRSLDTASLTQAVNCPAEGISVLLVEDDKIAAKVNQLLFQQFNCIVEVAVNGKSALYHAKARRYDLIVMDIGLPDKLGDKVAQEIRSSTGSQNADTPIVALTAHVNPQDHTAYLQAGIKAVFTKPLLLETAAYILKTFGPSQPQS
jgi:two-component system aerobic respiration control sensor histidine kinase ArcB